jgi:hypothetical protein
MSKKQGKPPRPPMPYLATAALCEKVLAEPDGATSCIRIVDTLTLTLLETPKLGAEAAIPLPLTLVISFKSGDFEGECILHLVVLTPSGKRHKIQPIPLIFSKPPEGGTNMRSPLFVPWDGEGLYWYVVCLDKKEYTRIPLRIRLSSPEPSHEQASLPAPKPTRNRRGKAVE